MMHRWRWGILVGIVLLAIIVRGWASLRLSVDFDEPTYLETAFDYARALKNGDLAGVIDYDENREHPALVKLVYGFMILGLGLDTDWQAALYIGRLVSALFGVLAVLVLALFDPLAGGLLAVHTMVVKYTSQVYLEALPHLASLVSVLALTRSRGDRDRWFWLSALALGLTAAGKFSYLPIVLVLLYIAIWDKRTRWYNLLLYGVVALAIFWILNPTLWREPVTRLADSLFFHARYSQGPRVEQSGYPWHRPLAWISRSWPSLWHPDAFIYPALDGPVFLLALPGLYWEWKERRWVVVWIAISLFFLLVWPTKWPQYTLVLTPALCMSAATALRHIYDWLRERETYWDWFRQMIPVPPLSFWILSGVVIMAVAGIYTAATLDLTLGRLGWSHMTIESSFLPSNIVYDLLVGSDQDLAEGMVLATERGAAFWLPPETTDLPDRWTILTTENSGLPSDRVLSLARDTSGNIWFGTEAGLAGHEQGQWQTYQAGDMGLIEDRVYALAPGSDGRLWVGTSTGAAIFEAGTWEPLTTANSGLVDNWVTTIIVQPTPEGDRVWFGTEKGISRLDTSSGEWTSFTEGFDQGVGALLLGDDGSLWAGTLGNGLGRWDGQDWQFYWTGNSEIPNNTVTALAEKEPGVLWVGTAEPMEAGGALAEFSIPDDPTEDEGEWRLYATRNSGFSAAEPLIIVQDREGRWWIGTRTTGVDIYQATQ